MLSASPPPPRTPEPPSAEDVEACRAITARHSRSFYAASHLMGGDTRAASLITYAFCRAADDDVDDAASLDDARAQHQGTRAVLQAIYDDAPPPTVVARSFHWVVRKFGIPMEEPGALLDGMAMDLGPVRTADEDALLLYCYRAAGVVGRIMCRILGRGDAVALRHAVDLGVAMQLTNIARDVGEDARRDRVYLPETWLQEAGSSTVDVLRGAPSPAINAVTLRVLALADRYYASGLRGVRMLPFHVRPAIMAAGLIYREIGVKVRARGGDGVTSRARVGGARKAWLALAAITRALFTVVRPEPATHEASLHLPLLRAGVRT